MKIDADLVLELRAERSWSQEELGIASGLNIRTIQRIEKEATISLQSKKALASAFDIDIHDLDYKEMPSMKKYEYKSVVLKFDIGWSKRASSGPFEFDDALNKHAVDGWRLKHLIQGTTVHGGSGQAIVFLEREVIE
jgi:transcriptional regulator with XRE-family HTH domain